MKRIWVLAGTTEGRELCALLSSRSLPFLATVATPYGAQLVQADHQSEVRIGKLDQNGMAALLQHENIIATIDATHPYAVEASKNAKAACEVCGIPYLRLNREEAADDADGIVRVRSVAEAANFLNEHEGNALVTTGGNGVADYTAVHDFASRLFIRILPDSTVLAKCEKLGFCAGNIIAMRGPFSEELNVALIKATNAGYLVTKDSGAAGGMAEKIAAAKKTGATIVLIERQQADSNASVSLPAAADWAQTIVDGTANERAADVIGQNNENTVSDSDSHERSACESEHTIESFNEIKTSVAETKAFFPLFVDLDGKDVVIVGGGTVGTRRVEVLSSFGARVRVISPAVSNELQKLIESGAVEWTTRGYKTGDCRGTAIVVAATNDRTVNAAVAQEAKAAGIPISIADAPDEATFHFPAIVRERNTVLGLTTGNPARTKKIAANLRMILPQILKSE